MNIKMLYFPSIVEQAQLFNPLISQIFDFFAKSSVFVSGLLGELYSELFNERSQSTKCEQRCFRRLCFEKGMGLKTDQNIFDTYFLISKRVQEAKISSFCKLECICKQVAWGSLQ